MEIVRFKRKDKNRFLALCREFYCAGATLRPYNEKNALLTFRRVLERHENLQGYLLVDKSNRQGIGYALVSSYWCNEDGGNVIVLDELYISPNSRHNGYGSLFLKWLEKHCGSYARTISLEVLRTNQRAQSVYRKDGMEPDGFITYSKEIGTEAE